MDAFAMDTNVLRAVLLVCMVVGFLGIWAWAWSSKRKTAFRDASELPLEEDRETSPENGAKE